MFILVKMAKWTGVESGILRKKAVPEKLEELLVFGYACKLFRDDEKALYIDQGKHLIPWMGDDKLKIDRYDCRGALSDLTTYEASREGYDAMRWLGLSESDRKIEQLCDEERYYSLNANEEEEEMYKEEEQKRLQQKTNEFSYSYDVPQDPDAVQALNPPTVEEDEREYIPLPELLVPADIAIPKNVKENARIEKTAHFVSKQGPQMEILIKAKQADNPQFSFLNQTDPLYKYYKHMLSAIKAGSYKVETAAKEEGTCTEVLRVLLTHFSCLSASPELMFKPYENNVTPELNQRKTKLSKTLAKDLICIRVCKRRSSSLQVQSTMPQVPLVSYKPTADCTYSQLVNRIQGSHGEGAMANKPEAPQVMPSQGQMTYDQQQQYYQYYYVMQYYEYYKQMVAQFHNLGDSDGQNIPPHIQEQINAQAMTFAQMAYTQYIQQNSTSNPYAQIVSNLSQNKDNIYPYQATANVQDLAQISDISKAPVLYSSEGIEPVTPSIPPVPPEKDEPQKLSVEIVLPQPKKALLSLINYGSDTGESNESEEEEEDNVGNLNEDNDDIKNPPDDVKIIIDKMASYVSKNGADFENIVRAKGDTRFNFLEDTHEHHAYYQRKVAEFAGPLKPEKKSASETNGVQHTKTKEKKIITPVSFSIKKPKEEIPKDIKSALPVEESDEDETEDSSVQSHGTASSLTSSCPASNVNLSECPPVLSETSADSEQAPKDKVKKTELEKIEATPGPVDDPILEMIDLTDDMEERKDAKRAEDKIKDKLAAAAREKLASASKDRALQIERKKKAAAFLKLKSAESTTENKKEDKTSSDDKVLVISDTENLDEKAYRRSRSRTRDKYVKKKAQSDSEEGEIKKHKKSSKKKRSHKRKHSKSRHESRSHQHKKSRKRRRRSDSYNSDESSSS